MAVCFGIIGGLLMAINPKDYADYRDVPRYTLGDVAWYLDIPESTLRAWCLGRNFNHFGRRIFSEPLIKPALYDPHNPSLSFYNLAEVHVLSATRKSHGFSMQTVRAAIDFLAAHYPSSHPLLGHESYTDGKDLFIKKISETINLSKKGQLAFKELVDMHLNRIEVDGAGLPTKVYPIRHKDATKKPIMIVPNVGGGQPVTPKKGIRISVLLSRREAGESYRDIAEDYGLSASEVEEACQYMAAA
jgi:uncharacterized protein (DUF433 family)